MIERWELLQAQDLSKEMRTKQNQQQWQQLNSDLNNVWTWLGETEEELEQQQRLDLSTDIQTIELRIKKLKVLLFFFIYINKHGCSPQKLIDKPSSQPQHFNLFRTCWFSWNQKGGFEITYSYIIS